MSLASLQNLKPLCKNQLYFRRLALKNYKSQNSAIYNSTNTQNT